MYMYVFVSARLVAAATIRERRLFRSALAQVRLLFESGVYSRGASIRSYTVYNTRLVYVVQSRMLGVEKILFDSILFWFLGTDVLPNHIAAI